MKKFDNILVIENDIKEVPSYFKDILDMLKQPKEYWYDFNMSFYHDHSGSMDRMIKIPDNTLIACCPSFVGAGNSFDGYMLLFYMLQAQGKKLNLAIHYPDNFLSYVLNFISRIDNASKKADVLGKIKDIFSNHSIYILDGNYSTNYAVMSHLTYDVLMSYYFETHRKLDKTKVRIKSTGEVYDVYSVYYYENMEDTKITLYIESDPNNSFKLNEIEKV